MTTREHYLAIRIAMGWKFPVAAAGIIVFPDGAGFATVLRILASRERILARSALS